MTRLGHRYYQHTPASRIKPKAALNRLLARECHLPSAGLPSGSTDGPGSGSGRYWPQVSVSCAGILFAMNKKTLNDWRLPIAPNALVSIFITLSKSALLLIVGEAVGQLKWIYFQERRHRLLDLQIFDEASRGPWGSCVLLRSLRHRAAIASFGAILTIVSLAMDPFAQQVISYDTTLRNATTADNIAGTSALLRQANRYDNGFGIWDWGIYGADQEIQANTTITVITGLSHSIPQTSLACPSGNCTWPVLETLGVCNQCRNLSDIILPACRSFPLSGNRSTDGCNITNDGLTTEIYIDFVAGYGSTVLNMSAEYEPLNQDGRYDGSLSNILAAAKVDINLTATDATNILTPITQVYSCELSLCAKKYNSTVSNGIFKEVEEGSKPLVFPECSLPAQFGNRSIWEAIPDPSPWLDPSTNLTLCPGFPLDSVPPQISPSNKTAMLSDPNIFWINAATIQNLRIELKNLLTGGSAIQEEVIGGSSLGFRSDTVVANLLFYSNEWNIPKGIEGIAAALTHQIRHGSNATWTIGSALTPVPLVLVQWIWITLPLALVLLSITFLGVAIAFSNEPARFVWKSSILGPVFHRVVGSSEDELDRRSLEDMELMARKVDVILANDENGRISLCRQLPNTIGGAGQAFELRQRL